MRSSAYRPMTRRTGRWRRGRVAHGRSFRRRGRRSKARTTHRIRAPSGNGLLVLSEVEGRFRAGHRSSYPRRWRTGSPTSVPCAGPRISPGAKTGQRAPRPSQEHVVREGELSGRENRNLRGFFCPEGDLAGEDVKEEVYKSVQTARLTEVYTVKVVKGSGGGCISDNSFSRNEYREFVSPAQPGVYTAKCKPPRRGTKKGTGTSASLPSPSPFS